MVTSIRKALERRNTELEILWAPFISWGMKDTPAPTFKQAQDAGTHAAGRDAGWRAGRCRAAGLKLFSNLLLPWAMPFEGPVLQTGECNRLGFHSK